MAFPRFKLQFQLTVDFSCLHKQHAKLLLSGIEVSVDEKRVETHQIPDSAFNKAQGPAGLQGLTIPFTCNVPYDSTLSVHLCYRKKPTGDILLSDKSSQKFWHAIPVTAPILNEDISVSYPLEIRGLPVAKVCIAIDRSAVEAFLAVVNAAACPNSSTLPTIVNLQSLIRKLAKYSVYNGRAFYFAGLHLHGLMIYVDNYPADKAAYMKERKLVDHEGLPVDICNLRYNAGEDLLSHMRRVFDFAIHCTSIISFPGALSERFHELFHYIALCAESLCEFAPIYLFGTYRAVTVFKTGAMDTFKKCHHALLYCRTKLTLVIKRMPNELASVPVPNQSPTVVVYLYHKARSELRIDPNWPMESFTAALIYVCGPVFDTVIHWIRQEITSAEGDAHMRDMLRRLAVHMIQQAEIIPDQLMYLPGQLTLARRDDAERQRKPLPIGEGSYASVYQGCYTPPLLSGQERPKSSFLALKCMRFLSDCTAEDMRQQRQRMILELVNTWMLEHEYILSLTAVIFRPELSPFILVFPWMSNSNVRVRLRHFKEGQQTYEGKLQNLSNRWIGQIATGLDYVHSEGIVHGDLRGVNILVDQKNNIKISDFGLSLYVEGMSKNYASAREGNPAWTAPEIFDMQTMKRLRATRESDIYSFAMVCIELWTLSDPIVYPPKDRPCRPMSPDPVHQEQMPDTLWLVVNKCWDKDPRKRPTASELKKELQSINILL